MFFGDKPLNMIEILQVKIWFQNHRYKCKRQAKEKAMAEQNAQNQVRYFFRTMVLIFNNEKIFNVTDLYKIQV